MRRRKGWTKSFRSRAGLFKNPDPTGDEARKYLKYIIDGAQFIAKSDQDDYLGTLAVDIPVTDAPPSSSVMYDWHFWGDDSNYTIR